MPGGLRIRARVNAISKKAERVALFLDEHAEKYGNAQPDKTEIHFPEGFTKEKVYRDYLRYMADEYEEPNITENCSQSYFNKVWKKRKSNLKCREWTTFTKCRLCTEIKSDLQRAPNKQHKGNHVLDFVLISC